MLLKRILTTVLGSFCLAPLLVFAQTSPPGSLTVQSSPQGAEVVLSGDAVLSGVTPTTFVQTLIGEYRVTLTRHGYEKYTTRITGDPSKAMGLDVRLTPKSRFKAAARSVLIPGWGQRYSEEKGKGLLYTALAAGAALCYFIADDKFSRDYDRYQDQLHKYDSSKAAGATYQTLAALHTNLGNAQQKAYDAEQVRRMTIGAVVGIWGLNVLDALLFFPEDHSTFSVKGVSLSPSTSSGTLGMTLSKRF